MYLYFEKKRKRNLNIIFEGNNINKENKFIKYKII